MVRPYGMKRKLSFGGMPSAKLARSAYSLRNRAPRFRRSSRGTAAGKKILNVGGTLALRGWGNSGGELKYVDLASAAYACDTTGSVTALNLTAVGDDNTTRDGRQITVTSCHIRGAIQRQDDSTTENLARWMLVWDKQPNSGTIATITQILSASTSMSSTNLDNRERFVILRDKQYAIGSCQVTTTVQGSPTTCDVNEYVKINCRTTYSGTTAAIGSVATGALLLVTIGQKAAADAHNLQCTTRVRFTDN